MSFVPSLVEAFNGFKPGQADIVFVSSDRSAELQRRYMEEGMYDSVSLLRLTGYYQQMIDGVYIDMLLSTAW